MRALGHLWLWVGFLGAAFASLYQLEVSHQKWATIPWGWYTFAMCIGAAGVAVLRHAKQHDHADDEKTEAEYSVLQQSLETVLSTLDDLRSQNEPAPAKILHRIDDEIAEPLSDFADSRQAMVKRFGLSTYAEVMTEFASGERYVNRAWSAAADGYVEEVASSLERASGHLQKAKQILLAAEG